MNQLRTNKLLDLYSKHEAISLEEKINAINKELGGTFNITAHRLQDGKLKQVEVDQLTVLRALEVEYCEFSC